MTTIVRPRARCDSASWIAASDSGSANAVASSSTMIGRSAMSARAIATRCSSPPDSRASTPDDRVVAALERRDAVVDLRRARGRLDVGLRRVRAAEADVVA